mmetsp:Transcript_8292/g.27557  ORF Transcript_8292/g.27557 Transcript_8292/m.27557 type:complete len:270 (+) Transcript_8292:2349-3158(+)
MILSHSLGNASSMSSAKLSSETSAATTASSSIGLNVHVEYTIAPPGFNNCAHLCATASCVACSAFPILGLHRVKHSGSLRIVPSPLHGTSAKTCVYPPSSTSAFVFANSESSCSISRLARFKSPFASTSRGTYKGMCKSCPNARVTHKRDVSLASLWCLSMASVSVLTRPGCASFACTTLPPPHDATHSSSCIVFCPGAAHTSSTRTSIVCVCVCVCVPPTSNATTGNMLTTSCLAPHPFAVANSKTSKTPSGTRGRPRFNPNSRSIGA